MPKTVTCKQPDRHNVKMMCGYPLPCPYHTTTIDMSKDPPTITIPITADAAWDKKHRLAEIAETLEDI